MKIREYVILLLLCFTASVFAQDLAGTFGTTNATPGTPPLPTSVRFYGPFNDSNPGTEGQIGVDMNDPNHAYMFHMNHWRSYTLQTTIQ